MAKKPSQFGQWAKYTQLGVQLVVTILVCIFAGHWADGYFGFEKPWLTLTGSILGIALGMYQFLKGLPKPDK